MHRHHGEWFASGADCRYCKQELIMNSHAQNELLVAKQYWQRRALNAEAESESLLTMHQDAGDLKAEIDRLKDIIRRAPHEIRYVGDHGGCSSEHWDYIEGEWTIIKTDDPCDCWKSEFDNGTD